MDCCDNTGSFPYVESQLTVSRWAEETFGPGGNNASCAARAMKEMAELVFALAKRDDSDEAGAEAADVVICLYRVAGRMGFDLHEEVDKKMRINRAREWNIVDGHGQHK